MGTPRPRFAPPRHGTFDRSDLPRVKSIGVWDPSTASSTSRPIANTGVVAPRALFALRCSRSNLIAGHGIEGDRKAGHHPDRQVNLISREWLLRMQDAGYRISPGQFGEQITLVDIDLDQLKRGERLQLGDTACIEIRQARHPCSRLQVAQQLPFEGLKAVGVMGSVDNRRHDPSGRPGDSTPIPRQWRSAFIEQVSHSAVRRH